MALPVLAATLTTVVVFFPVTFLYGVSKYLFSALALAVALSLFASFAVALTVVPLFCARFIRISAHHGTPSNEQPVTVDHAVKKRTLSDRFNIWFNNRFESFLKVYDVLVGAILRAPGVTLGGLRPSLCREPRAVPAAGPLLLPPHGCRPVRHQPQGSLRHAPQRHGE